MKQPHTVLFRKVALLTTLLLLLSSSLRLPGQPTPATTAAFDSYVRITESRLAQQHESPSTFLALPVSKTDSKIETKVKDLSAVSRQGDPIIENLTPPESGSLSGALLHHWRGTAFAPGAKSTDFERLMRDFSSYPKRFAPQVVEARVISQNSGLRPDRLQATMRVRQRHVITVILDSTYDITFGQLDSQHGYSLSRSTRIAEIESPGTNAERSLNSSQEHGFLWRLNTYWSYEERDGGLYLQIEAVSLTRSIPIGLGWAVRPYIDSIPRDSLEFTLRSTCDALRR
jgi:hypothetical protein